MDFLDEILKFGSGALDSIGEHADWLGGWLGFNNGSNPSGTQQPNRPIVDSNGSPSSATQPNDNTLLYVGGAMAVVVIILIIVMQGD